MAELLAISPRVVAVLAPGETCDRVASSDVGAGVRALRVAPREVLLVGPVQGDVVGRAADDASAIVDDVSDAWAGFVLEGPCTRDAFSRLSGLALPERGWLQGEVAGVAAKVMVEDARLTLLVPSMLAAHVEERIRADAAEVLGR